MLVGRASVHVCRGWLQAGLKAAELAKRALDEERRGLAMEREALAAQQAQAEAELARLAELHKVGWRMQAAAWLP
jgi:hypothetical protein